MGIDKLTLRTRRLQTEAWLPPQPVHPPLFPWVCISPPRDIGLQMTKFIKWVYKLTTPPEDQYPEAGIDKLMEAEEVHRPAGEPRLSLKASSP